MTLHTLPPLLSLLSGPPGGHRAGDDVFGRIYTLDHPEIAPLVKVAAILDDKIAASIGTLLTPTTRRPHWGKHNPLRDRAEHITATLTNAGWLVDPGSPDDPLCDAERVAAELDIHPNTARRWMADGTVAAIAAPDAQGVPRRYSRLREVWAQRDRLAQRILLPDLAEQLGVRYHEVYNTVRRLGLVTSASTSWAMPWLRASQSARRLAGTASGDGREADLGCAAEPDLVAGADPLMCGQVHGHRVAGPVPGGAAAACGSGTHCRAFAGTAGAERGGACWRALALTPVIAARCQASLCRGCAAPARSSHAAARAANHGGRQAVISLTGMWLAAATRVR